MEQFAAELFLVKIWAPSAILNFIVSEFQPLRRATAERVVSGYL